MALTCEQVISQFQIKLKEESIDNGGDIDDNNSKLELTLDAFDSSRVNINEIPKMATQTYQG